MLECEFLNFMRPIILIGGGGHCKSVIDAAESSGVSIRGILDVAEKVGQCILSYEIIGTDDDIKNYVGSSDFIVTKGFIKNTKSRIFLHKKILDAGGHFGKIVASTAHVSRYAYIGDGTVILQQAVVNADSKIGFGCIINSCANIEHDVIVGDYSHISTGAMINGECKIGSEVFIGSNSVVNNCTDITDGCVIASGSVVRSDITECGLYAGNPAVFKKLL